MVISKPFQNYALEIYEKHIDENLEVYVEGTLSVAKRRILTRKWVADAWRKIKKQPDMIKHSFSKCGFFNNLHGTKDDQIKNKGNWRLHNAFRREGVYSLEGDKESGS